MNEVVVTPQPHPQPPLPPQSAPREPDPSGPPRTGSAPGAIRAGFLRPIIQTSAFVRKELVEVIRQPRLLVVLIVAPFLVLSLFAAGYDQDQLVLRTRFVVPSGGLYEPSIEQFAGQLTRYVQSKGVTGDRAAAERDLRNGELDLVVVLPPDPLDTVLAGRQATIDVLHDKLDPIQQTAVEVAAEVAVQELNATIAEKVVGEAQQDLRPLAEEVASSRRLLDEVRQASSSGDRTATNRRSEDLADAVDRLATAAEGGLLPEGLRTSLGGASDSRAGSGGDAFGRLDASVEQLRSSTRRLAESGGSDPAAAAAVEEDLRTVENGSDRVLSLDPRLVARPFERRTKNLSPQPVNMAGFFSPAAIALLVQHLALTLAAMSLVADRSLGLFETFRVGPVGAGRVVLGKFLAHAVLGGTVGAALVAAVTIGLGVPFAGSVAWVAIALVGVVAASIGLGMILALVARSDIQAVQYALLVLLAGLFFGGFLLEVDAFRYPVKAISWLLPVTYGVRLLRGLMLQGREPASRDLLGLACITLAYLAVAWTLLSRRLRVE